MCTQARSPKRGGHKRDAAAKVNSCRGNCGSREDDSHSEHDEDHESKAAQAVGDGDAELKQKPSHKSGNTNHQQQSKNKAEMPRGGWAKADR